MTDFQAIFASRKRMKRQRRVARLVTLPLLLAVCATMPLVMVGCRLMGRGR